MYQWTRHSSRRSFQVCGCCVSRFCAPCGPLSEPSKSDLVSFFNLKNFPPKRREIAQGELLGPLAFFVHQLAEAPVRDAGAADVAR